MLFSPRSVRHLHLTVCGLAKVAILNINVHTKHIYQIYEKLSYEAQNRHFCQTAVRRMCLVFRQFVKAKISENIVNISVIGVNSLRSNLFFDIAFPKVLNKNKAVIAHNKIGIIFFGKSIIKN